MAQTKLRKVNIPIILYNGAGGYYATVYYTDTLAAPGEVGSFSNTITLPTNSTYNGYILVGYKLRFSNYDFAFYNPGSIATQTGYGYNSGTQSYVNSVKTQYEELSGIGYSGAWTLNDMAKSAASSPGAVTFVAVYKKAPLKLNGVILNDVKQIKLNGNDVKVLRHSTSGGTLTTLFSKTLLTLKYISKVNIPVGGGEIPWTGSCNIETATGVNSKLMVNNMLNKHALPANAPYAATIDTNFERIEPYEIKSWKDNICLPASEERHFELIIPQRSRYISSVTVYQVVHPSSGSPTETSLGENYKLTEFDAVNISQTGRTAPLAGSWPSLSKVYNRNKIGFYNNKLGELTSSSRLKWQFKLTGAINGSSWFEIRFENSLGELISSQTIRGSDVINNKTYSGEFDFNDYKSAGFYFSVVPVNMTSGCSITYMPFYVKK